MTASWCTQVSFMPNYEWTWKDEEHFAMATPNFLINYHIFFFFYFWSGLSFSYFIWLSIYICFCSKTILVFWNVKLLINFCIRFYLYLFHKLVKFCQWRLATLIIIFFGEKFIVSIELDFYWLNILRAFLEVREKCKTYLYFFL